jgi:hypothetical protein
LFQHALVLYQEYLLVDLMISTRVSLHATRKHCKSNTVLEGIDKGISAKEEVHSSSKWEDLQPELLLPKLEQEESIRKHL